MHGRARSALRWAAALTVAVSSAVGATGASAAPAGSPETGFGSAGIVDLRLGDFPGARTTAAAPAPSGGMLVLAYGTTASYSNIGARIGWYTASGAPQPGFGRRGAVDVPQPEHVGPDRNLLWIGVDATAAGDGVVVAARETLGTSYLTRVGPTGTLDVGFGTDGVLRLPSPVVRVRQAPGGDLVVLLHEADGLVVRRFDAQGAPRSGFGTGGRTVIGLTPEEAPEAALTVLPSGDVLVGGARGATGEIDPAAVQATVTRLTPDGQPDTQFGSSGHAPVGGSGYGSVSDVQATADGRLVALVRLYRLPSSATVDGRIHRLEPSGAPSAAAVAEVLGAVDGALAVDGAARALVATREQEGTGTVVRRFSTGGVRDATFADGGALRVSASEVRLVPDAGPVLVGALPARDTADTLLGRLGANGLDPLYGSGGLREVQVGSVPSGLVHASTLLPDGRLVALGRYRTGPLTTGAGSLVLDADGRGFSGPRGLDGPLVDGGLLAVVRLADGTHVALGDALDADRIRRRLVTVPLGPDGHPDTAVGLRPAGLAVSGVDPDVVATRLGEGFAVAMSVPTAWVLGRFAADGSTVTTFGTGGTVSHGETADAALALGEDASGRLLALVGRPSSEDLRLRLRRYLPTGGLDPALGGDGELALDGFGGFPGSTARLIALPGGDVLVAGSDRASTGRRVRLARVAGDGSVAVSVPEGASEDRISHRVEALSRDPQGRVLVAGTEVFTSGTSTGELFLRRLGADLQPEPSYGTLGEARVSRPDEPIFFGGLSVRPSGAAVLAGTIQRAGPRWFAAELRADGDPVTPSAPEPTPTPTPAPPQPPAPSPSPSPTPTPTPAAPRPPATGVRPAPAGLAAPRSLGRASLTSRGLRVRVQCAGPCRVTVTATLDARTARSLGLRSRRLATRAVTSGSVARAVTLRPATAASRRLRRLRRTATLVVRVSGRSTVTGAALPATTASVRIRP